MFLLRDDPGRCPVCGAPHTTCTSAGYLRTIVVGDALLPGRDAAAMPAPAAPADPNTFTTASYRSALNNPTRRRGPV